MYRESAVLYRELLVFIILFVCLETAIAVVDSRWPAEGATFFISTVNWVFLSYVAFSKVLASHVVKRSNVFLNFAGFTLKFFCLFALIMVPALVAAVLILEDSSDTDFEDQIAGTEDLQTALVDVSAVLIILVIFIVVFALLGSWLAAHVVRHKQSIAVSFRQGKRAFLRTVSLLVAGPFVLELIAYGSGLWAMYLSTGDAYAFEGKYDIVSANWQLNAPVTIVYLAAQVVSAFSIITTAWVLSKTFLATVEEIDLVAVFE